MTNILRKILIVAAIAFAANAIEAADVLPVTTRDGKQFYEYVVPKLETIYAITHKFGISREELFRYNPSLSKGLKAGAIVYLPVESVRKDRVVPQPVVVVTDKDYTHLVKKGETLYGLSRRYDTTVEKLLELNPWAEKGLKTGQVLRIPVTEVAEAPEPDADTDTDSDDYESETPMQAPLPQIEETFSDSLGEYVPPVDKDREYNIAVMLPFMLNDEEESKSAQSYTGFLKGMLLAADSLGREEGNLVTITAYDTEGSDLRLAQLLSSEEVRNADVIIGPDTQSQLDSLAASSDSTDYYVMNIFNIQDESYLQHPHLIQANIGHKRMYEKAILAMAEMYPDYTLVALYSEAGKNEKQAFVDDAKHRYHLASMPVVEITYGASLRRDDLDTLDTEGKYLFLPSSGTLAEFNKVQGAILDMKQRAGDPDDIRIFGYPDWTAFRLDRLDRLHELGATIYSRFYDKTVDGESSLPASYQKWYGEEIRDMVPKYELLGFDVGAYLIGALRANGGDFTQDYPLYSGEQSSFKFPAPDNPSEGMVNDALYIITYRTDKSVVKQVR